MDKNVEERFERIEAILENVGKRLDHASEVLDRAAQLVEETWTLTRQNQKNIEALIASREEPSRRLQRSNLMR